MNGSSTIRTKIWKRAMWQSGLLILAALLLGVMVNNLRPGGLPLVGNWSPVEQLKASGLDEGIVISLDEAETLFYAQQGVFVDARSNDLFREGHIQGALNLPVDEFEDRIDEVMRDVPKKASIITYCDGEGCGLSKELAQELITRGYENVRVLVNGWTVWKKAKLPITLARGK